MGEICFWVGGGLVLLAVVIFAYAIYRSND
jgi:hypothetical protein